MNNLSHRILSIQLHYHRFCNEVNYALSEKNPTYRSKNKELFDKVRSIAKEALEIATDESHSCKDDLKRLNNELKEIGRAHV